jgi:hypothetical protein
LPCCVTLADSVHLYRKQHLLKPLTRHRLSTDCDPYQQSRPTMDPPTLDVYKSYFDDPTLSDLTLKLSDRTVHIHRIVLCRASEYFTSLPTGSFQVIPLTHPHRARDQANCYLGKHLEGSGAPWRRPRGHDGTARPHLRALILSPRRSFQR